jgi:hypothetical protein
MIKLIKTYLTHRTNSTAQLNIDGKQKKGYKRGDIVKGYEITKIETSTYFKEPYIILDNKHKLKPGEKLNIEEKVS